MQFKTIWGHKKKVKKIWNYRIDWLTDSRSKLQFIVKNAIEPFWKNDVVFEEFPIVGSKLSLDFYNATRDIAIEVQGAQHTRHIEFFHGKGKSKFLDQIKRDSKKFKFCEINDIKLVEIFEDDFNLEDLIEEII